MGAADRIADTLLRIGQIQGDSLSRTGDIQARAMEIAAAARAGGVTGSADALARATAANGQIWGQTLAQLGQLPGQVIQQQRQGKIADQEMAMRKLQLDQATHAAAGEKALASNLAGDQLAPGATGPRQESYLGADGLFDVPKITQALASGGYGDIAPSLVKGAESINDSITKHQAAVRQATTAQTVLLGDMADGVSKMVKSGTPIDRALDFVAAPALASKSIDPQQYQQVRAQLLQLPPEQQQAALANLMDAANKLAPEKTLSEGAIIPDRYGRAPVATNPKPEPQPTEASLDAQFQGLAAKKAAGGTLTAAEQAQMDGYQARLDAKSSNKTPPGLEEQYLTAVTKGDTATAARILGTLKATAAAKRDPAAQALAGELGSLRKEEAQARLDNLQGEGKKAQESLEQQYRTGLITKIESSRSGGLGLEDQKVNQAVHLLTLFEQNKDPKTGEYTIPKMMIPEVALGLARLISPTGTPAESTVKDLEQRTAKGDLAGVITYLTGKPVTGNTQDIFKVFRDSIERQGAVAEENRTRYLAAAQAAAPTDLAPARRQAVESGLLQLTSVKRGDYKPQSASLSVTAPNGKTYTFQSQADADAFKAKAGIK